MNPLKKNTKNAKFITKQDSLHSTTLTEQQLDNILHAYSLNLSFTVHFFPANYLFSIRQQNETKCYIVCSWHSMDSNLIYSKFIFIYILEMKVFKQSINHSFSIVHIHIYTLFNYYSVLLCLCMCLHSSYYIKRNKEYDCFLW